MKQMKQMKEDIQKGTIQITIDGKINFLLDKELDMVCLASLMKLWLRELVDGVIPKENYDDFLNCPNSPSDLVVAIEKLDKTHQMTLKYILKFLMQVQAHKEFNKMGIKNVAIVFGPCLFRCPCDEGPEKTNQMLYMTQSMKTSDFVKKLLTNYAVIYGEKPVVTEKEVVSSVVKRSPSVDSVSSP
jgi:Rho GTPase-activating protein RGD1